MQQCLRERAKLAGCLAAVGVAAVELLALGVYLHAYAEYQKKNSSHSGTAIGVSVTLAALMACAILLMVGAVRRRPLCFLPWMLLHAALILEGILALGLCVVQSARTGVILHLTMLIQSEF